MCTSIRRGQTLNSLTLVRLYMVDEPAPAAGANHHEPHNQRKLDSQVAVERYLTRIGIDSNLVTRSDRDTLARLQRAHVTSVPFENLAIVGDPTDEESGDGVVLSIPQLHEKIVERERGGYCFELNGLFHSLLVALGYAVDRIPARIVSDDGAGPPANHHTNILTLDQRYVVDVGMGTPTMRRPTPLNGDPVTDEIGVTWRVVSSDRPDETFRLEYRVPSEQNWSPQYVFSDYSCDLGYFRATNDYLQTAPESTFTGDPVVTIATETGHRRLSRDRLTESILTDTPPTERSRTIPSRKWHETIKTDFGLHYSIPPDNHP